MGQLTAELKQAILTTELFPLATSSGKKLPNIVPVKFVFIENDNTLWLVDNFFNKTRSNIEENALAAIYVYPADASSCYQVKGTVEFKASGLEYHRMRTMVHSVQPDLPARALVVLSITKIYQCLPGTNAGTLISDCQI